MTYYPYGWESVSNDVQRGVESAIQRGFTVNQFIEMARECWEQELSDMKRFADQDFQKDLKILICESFHITQLLFPTFSRHFDELIHSKSSLNGRFNSSLNIV